MCCPHCWVRQIVRPACADHAYAIHFHNRGSPLQDPAVMAASLNALTEVAAHDPRAYKNLVPSFVSILKQVVEGKLPRPYEYHKAPAPFVQVRTLLYSTSRWHGHRAL